MEFMVKVSLKFCRNNSKHWRWYPDSIWIDPYTPSFVWNDPSAPLFRPSIDRLRVVLLESSQNFSRVASSTTSPRLKLFFASFQLLCCALEHIDPVLIGNFVATCQRACCARLLCKLSSYIIFRNRNGNVLWNTLYSTKVLETLNFVTHESIVPTFWWARRRV